MPNKITASPNELDEVEAMLMDNGYFSASNVTACVAAKIEPLIALHRQSHYLPLNERFVAAPTAPENSTPVEAMAHRLKTPV